MVSLVKPENFDRIIDRMSTVPQTAYHGPFDRGEIGLRIAVSVDAGMELVTSPCGDSDDPLIRWLVVYEVRQRMRAAVKGMNRLQRRPLDAFCILVFSKHSLNLPSARAALK